ncbi:MAG: glucose-6-phosphate dehydrogenase [Burkholderiaceae bacterium]
MLDETDHLPERYDLIFFGGTGDLTWRKLMPGLYQAYRHGALRGTCRVLGVARTEMTDEGYREWLREKLRTLSWDEPFDEQVFTEFASFIQYHAGNLNDEAVHQAVASWVSAGDAEAIVVYLATSPTLFETIARQVANAGLNDPRVRIVLEKPLGRDLDSAAKINDAVREHFLEHQIFRIDHYLGKQSVQNLVALRFGNTLFEPLWRRDWIESVQITLAEDLGVEGRGGYYDQSGALRDMVQNHLLQLLCMVAMEPPTSSRADDLRDEKLKVLRSLKPYQPSDVARYVVRGQYREGSVRGKVVPGYLEEHGVPPDSHTETFVALRCEIENWRWAGVPFYLRTGKRMAARCAEIVINFRPLPHAIFEGASNRYSNRLVISLQPEDTISLHLMAKASNRARAEQGRLAPVALDLDFRETFGAQMIEGYERLLRKLIAGRLDLFVRLDEQLAAWRWVMPILDTWALYPDPPRPYNAGTWGPSASATMLAREQALWPEEL